MPHAAGHFRTFVGLLVCLSGAMAPLPERALAGEPPASPERIHALRLAGELNEARRLASASLEAPGLEPELEIALRLELARIEDRIGLHRNARPVAEMLRQVEAAKVLAADASLAARARVESALAQYHYRAEEAGREFALAAAHAERAAEMFREAGDRHGEAEAVHQLGLVHLRRGELDSARDLFVRSLELDIEGGARTFFRGEYERHVGLIELQRGDTAAAIPHFERSLAARRAAGAIDASLFAARILAAALLDVGRASEAREPLLYALLVAERIDSPVGRARVGITLGELYEKTHERDAAIAAYEWAFAAAETVHLESIAARARDALARLDSTSGESEEVPTL